MLISKIKFMLISKKKIPEGNYNRNFKGILERNLRNSLEIPKNIS